MVGSALVRQLHTRGDAHIVTASRSELDLTNQAAVQAFFEQNRIDQVYLEAAKVGGIARASTASTASTGAITAA